MKRLLLRNGDDKTADGQNHGYLLMLSVVAIVAAVVRVYALGVPMFVHDETLVVDTALRNVDYIFNRSLYADAHPPFFYYLYSLLEWQLRSEFLLRLPLALCGIASVILLYNLCSRYLSRQVGLVAASLLAVDLIHVAISRVVRPHALVAMLGLICAYRLLRFLEEPSRRNIALLWLANFLVSLWHFNGSLVIGSQLAVLVVMGATRRVPRGKALLALAATGSCLIVPLFFLLNRLGQFPGVDIGHGVTMLWTLQRTIDNLIEIFSFSGGTWFGVALLAVMVIGIAVLAKMQATLATVLGLLAFAPLAALVVMRYGIIYQPYHIIFVVPFLFVFVAVGLLQTRVNVGLLALSLVLVGGYDILAHKQNALYETNSEFLNNNLRQKSVYQKLPPRLAATDIVEFYPGTRIDGVNWEYLKNDAGDLRHLSISPHDAAVNFYLVKFLDYPPEDGERMFGIDKAGYASIASAAIDNMLRITGYRIDREPTLVFDAVPAVFTLSATPEDFFRRVHAASDLMTTFSPLGNAVGPANYDTPAVFSFRFKNSREQIVPDIEIQAEIENAWPKNAVAMTYRFYDGPPETGFDLSGTVFQGTAVLHLGRTKPFKTLDVAFRMTSASSKPSLYNNPDTLAFRRLQVSLQNDNPSFQSSLPVAVSGLDKTEGRGSQAYRWGLGPETVVRFHADKAQRLRLDLEGRSPIAGQTASFVLNGLEMPEKRLALGSTSARHSLAFDVPAGENELLVRYGFWNHGNHGSAKETFEPTDPRLLAASYKEFRLIVPE